MTATEIFLSCTTLMFAVISVALLWSGSRLHSRVVELCMVALNQASELDGKIAREKQLIDALRPFASVASVEDITSDDDVQLLPFEYAPRTATVGDCRKAAKIVSEFDAKGSSDVAPS